MIQSAETLASTSPQSAKAFLGRIMRVREVLLVLALLLVCALVALRAPRFLNATNLDQVVLSATLVCIVAVGQALVIIARQIDLSVGAIIAMSAFVSAEWLAANPTGSLIVVFLIGCLIGIAMGAANALLVAVFRIPAIVATLGTLAIYRGAVLVYAGGRQISATVLPDYYEGMARAHIAGIPFLVWLALIITVSVGLLARYSQIGRNIYALGSNPESAHILGISAGRVVTFVFVLSGFLSGLVGVLWGARFGTVDAVIAPQLNLQSISAVVIGGVSIFGGSGSVYGAAIGAVIFAVLQNGVLLIGINQFWVQAVVGAAILATVFFYSSLARRAERMQREARRRPERPETASMPRTMIEAELGK
jgi:rhamnose transport system permease protein